MVIPEAAKRLSGIHDHGPGNSAQSMAMGPRVRGDDVVTSPADGRGALCPIRHERADARHDVRAGRSGLHAVLRRARRDQVLAWRRAHRRRLHGAGDVRRSAGGRAELASRRARGDARGGRAGDGAVGRADRPLPGDAAAQRAGAQHAARHAHARHGAARGGAAVLSGRRQSQAVSGAAAGICREPRAFHAAARQYAHARGRRHRHRRPATHAAKNQARPRHPRRGPGRGDRPRHGGEFHCRGAHDLRHRLGARGLRRPHERPLL